MSIDFDKVTLVELEAVALRLSAVVTALREARELLGGAVAGPAVAPPATRPSHAPPELTAEEMARREALLRRNRDDLPADIKRAEGLS